MLIVNNPDKLLNYGFTKNKNNTYTKLIDTIDKTSVKLLVDNNALYLYVTYDELTETNFIDNLYNIDIIYTLIKDGLVEEE